MKSILVLLFLLFAHLATGQDKAHRIDSLLQAMHQEGKLNGCVLVAEKGHILYNKSFGYADEAKKRKLDENSIFELASVSKQFTAMAIVILKEKGKLGFDDKLSKHIPELAAYENITLRQMLNHTSGLPDYVFNLDSLFDKSKISTNHDLVNIFQKHKPALLFKPGTKWAYSNTGYDLLAVVVERASGMLFGDFLRKAIFKPLKMNNTFVYSRRLAPKQLDNYAYGYTYSEQSKKYVLPDEEEYSRFVVWLDGIAGAGGISSTVMDLLKWDRALYKHKLVSAESMKSVFSDPGVSKAISERYGFGWFLESFADLGKIVNHSGGWPGYRTFIDRHIDKDKTIIVLLNHDDGLIPLQGIRRILADKPFFDPAKAKPVSDSILSRYAGVYKVENVFVSIEKKEDGYYLFQENAYYKMYFSSDVDFFNMEHPSEKHFVTDASGRVSGYQRFYFGTALPMAHKIVKPDTIVADEQFFNFAGWHFLEQKKFEKAIRYLKRGLELYPDALLIQGNLAHGYLFNNDYEAASTIYKKHIGEEIVQGFAWTDMIRQDFMHFKKLGFDPEWMDKMLNELKL
ncbi:MAG: serine hydrolase [Saprospiraceae bacterium]|nr:serine hydrolase [Saprospiraceae bacterium]